MPQESLQGTSNEGRCTLDESVVLETSRFPFEYAHFHAQPYSLSGYGLMLRSSLVPLSDCHSWVLLGAFKDCGLFTGVFFTTQWRLVPVKVVSVAVPS